ncbi:MAG: GSCFA domain-containing protein [Chitinophagaceae bacterium]|nr:GSCFA domain-containing protein [Chitinophagaceae bacterium]
MDLLINIDLKKLPEPISYRDKIMLIGSCFTEHIGNALGELKYSVLQNPNGILFGPDSVCKSLLSYISPREYLEADLFRLNEIWNSWQHHSRYSNIDSRACIGAINDSQKTAHTFLKKADWLIITLGSSYSYQLTKEADLASESIKNGVANCHRAPANWFTKEMLSIDVISFMLEDCIKQLKQFNPDLKFLFTVSPVRHIRDGVVENNRSKARLIESVHYIVNKFESAFYFPAYELVIDVLRDYRFYDIDLVHPNYPATEFVLEKFAATCINVESQQLMKEIRKIMIARKHKAFQPATKSHQQFLMSYFEKTRALKDKYPFLQLDEELVYFSQT